MEPIKVTELATVFERLRADIVSGLSAQGFSIPPAAKREGALPDALIAAVRVSARSIERRPRKVRRSTALGQRALDSKLAEQVDLVAREFENGLDLNPRLTRRFFRSGFNDLLYNDLDIQHLHLGGADEGKKGQVGSTPELLFVIVEASEVFFLDVLDHTAFERADFISIVQSDWPENFVGTELPGVLPPRESDQFSAEMRAHLRAAGIATILYVDGKSYLSRGGPIATDGTSERVVRLVSTIRHELRSGHEWIVENASDIARWLEHDLRIEVSELDLYVRQKDGEYLFEEALTGALIYPNRGSYVLR